ncbi:hypothetical protein N7489_010635 [Penicillium chrysogenum]|jgi:hypothetical protein|uniref:Uncharacterized protein n=1 Tax=Penicillium chrysogenum TaxID=5076 RepID=A0ABQ8WT15_PENCH|nr:uncharacterized protein N7489_010635 [Penicillium chrysogenum]MBZ6433211.1 hypothetical protein [Acinetobacter pittii]KAJ5229927.1 hypothetical protein N7489_010635 [Penicillium chrysogenum]KAJ5271602.1 hypothetical protein N7524_004871 [Penicillium chrysogenum]KAJ5282179.1 hypothetical protein N7505_000159 [Penicillium chrysogenum]KAJ6141100.1 hypothetical protein N7497_011993 [Penicillium chrysogenum]
MSFFTDHPRAGRHDAEPEQPRVPRTQVADLPKPTQVTLLNIQKLRPDSSLTVWGNEVLHALRPFKLDALVDSDLPKPHPRDDDYQKWKFWTLAVSRWLYNQVDASLQLKVKEHPNEVTYADEMFSTIRRLSLPNQSKFLARELRKWEEIKRGSFATAADFIMAYQNQFNRLKTENHEPSCDFALDRLLNELHGEVLKAPYIQEELKDLGRPVNYQMFVYYCKVMVNESRNPSIPAAEASTMGGDGEGRGRSRGRDISYRSWRQSTKGRGPAWE